MGLDFLNEVTTCSESPRHRHYAAPGHALRTENTNEK